MANLTDPLIRSVTGTDPQNLMEYITRQKIYDSRFWKEECFGLTTVDVLERAAKSLTCVGGSYGGNNRPTKFLCLTLKLLQLQPDVELIDTFLEQDHFKYVKALGAFYLRLTGRPQDIYEKLEPLYSNYSKLKYRDVTEWKLIHIDEFIDELLTKPFACSIALPRLPKRSTLQDAGYLDDGPRPTILKPLLEDAGGVKEYLKMKVDAEQSREPREGDDDGTYTATMLWEQRFGKVKQRRSQKKEEEQQLDKSSEYAGGSEIIGHTDKETKDPLISNDSLKRKADDEDKASQEEEKEERKVWWDIVQKVKDRIQVY